MLFSLPEMVSDKKIRVDFDSPDISSNGGLVLIGNMHNSLAWQIGQLIPDSRKKEFIHHTYMEMVSQRIGQILCGYEDANDCNQLRGDSHFASHEFMDWAHDKWYVRYLTGLSGNSVLLSMVDKPRRRAESDYRKAQEAEDERYETLTRLGFHGVRHERVVIRRYYNLNVIFSFCREINGEFYHPPHVEIQTEKRALPVDIIRAIANLPDNCS